MQMQALVSQDMIGFEPTYKELKLLSVFLLAV